MKNWHQILHWERTDFLTVAYEYRLLRGSNFVTLFDIYRLTQIIPTFLDTHPVVFYCNSFSSYFSAYRLCFYFEIVSCIAFLCVRLDPRSNWVFVCVSFLTRQLLEFRDHIWSYKLLTKWTTKLLIWMIRNFSTLSHIRYFESRQMTFQTVRSEASSRNCPWFGRVGVVARKLWCPWRTIDHLMPFFARRFPGTHYVVSFLLWLWRGYISSLHLVST